MTDKYLHVHYYADVASFIEASAGKVLIAIDNTDDALSLGDVALPPNAMLLFGAEGPGIRPELCAQASAVAKIDQYGSTRSLNVGVAAGIAMYEWTRRNSKEII